MEKFDGSFKWSVDVSDEISRGIGPACIHCECCGMSSDKIFRISYNLEPTDFGLCLSCAGAHINGEDD